MSNKFKCPVCQNNLHKINVVVSTCTNDKCKLWGSSIPNLVLEALTQAKQDLDFFIKEQVRSSTALIERTKELNKYQQDLKNARNALEELIAYYDHYDSFDGEISWDGVALIMRNDAHEALEQIEHKEK